MSCACWRKEDTDMGLISSKPPPKSPKVDPTLETSSDETVGGGGGSGPDGSRANRNRALGGDDPTGRRLVLTDKDFVDRNAALKPIDDHKASELRPETLDLNIIENRKAHNTSEYEHVTLIVRRGQAFDIKLTFDREFNKEKDTVLLQFTYGSRPQESKGSIVRLPINEGDDKSTDDQWAVTLTGQEGHTICATVKPSAKALVGRYRIYVETETEVEGEKLKTRKEFDESIFTVLFNPWCKADQVYMEDEKERDEYVLNENGRLYQGSSRHVTALPWNFGQFEDVCLDAALYLLDKSELAATACSNPVHICRTLSAMSNCSDGDGGVLTGRWTDTFPKDCTLPWVWVGSVAILEEFMRTKKAVRFGQCWVFSGIVTTLLRALGIPTRSVTNFDSAHDCDASVTIDYHWAEDDKPLNDMNDSVWNFHVWNESWFARYDLPDGYDGWQAHDATPQEASNGVMRCGPAPIKALKEGHVYLPYDAPFIFAEVNGDKVHWRVKDDGSLEHITTENKAVGRKISTKAVGNNSRNDITLEYKHKEGSEEERDAVARAFRYSTRRHLADIYDQPEPDVSFELDTPEQLQMGKDFAFSVHMKNNSDEKEKRTVKLRLTAVVSYYTGVPSADVATDTFEVSIEPDEEESVTLPVCFEDVAKILKPDSTVTVYLKGNVVETGRCYAHIEAFDITKPALTVSLSKDEVEVGDEFDVTLTFTNPLDKKLTGGQFQIEAPGIAKGLIIPYRKTINAHADVEHTVSLKARRSGTKEIMASFSADQISGLTGSEEIRVKYNFG